MGADRVTPILLTVLKEGLARPGEQRLYRSGKLEGLFPSRAGAHAEAAARAIREGLVEVVRTETRGKTSFDWVRLTPRALEFVHAHESPVRALHDLRAALEASRAAVPAWQEEMRQALARMTRALEEDSRRLLHRLDTLARRVDEALDRLALTRPHVPDDLARSVPWAGEVLDYLDRRRTGGLTSPCPLPELFGATASRQTDLTLAAFHDGLRRLHDRRVLGLLPPTASAEPMAQPEFALFDGGQVLYYATL